MYQPTKEPRTGTISNLIDKHTGRQQWQQQKLRNKDRTQIVIYKWIWPNVSVQQTNIQPNNLTIQKQNEIHLINPDYTVLYENT